MESLYNSAVLVGFTLLIGVIAGLLIAMRNRAPVIQVGERDVESRSIFGAILFGFGVIAFVGFLYLMVPKDYRLPNLPSPNTEASTGESTVQASIKLDSVVEPETEEVQPDAPVQKKPAEVPAPAAELPVRNRELIIIQSNAFGVEKNADREVARLKQQHPACKVLIDGKLYHTGYGPFASKAKAERVKREKGLVGMVVTFYY